MILPIFACDGAVCFAGIGWRPEQLAAFLAWWMPLNLLSYWAMLALMPLWIEGIEWNHKSFSLKQFMLMMFIFWPLTVGRTAYVLGMVALETRDRKKRKTNQQVYLTDEDV